MEQENLLLQPPHPAPNSFQGFWQILGYKVVFMGHQVRAFLGRAVVGNHISDIFVN